MISIIDYGMGNLRSVQKAFEREGAVAEIVTTPEQVLAAKRLVLPGVGAFRDAIATLKELELVEPLREYIAADRPFLGICLGLQLLFDVSFEEGEWPGLGILAGPVVRFPAHSDRKVPHMGWNQLQLTPGCPLFEQVSNGAHVYFVHSYFVQPSDPTIVAATCEYGGPFTAVVQRGRLFATQFHPEKSQRTGLQMLRNFATMPT